MNRKNELQKHRLKAFYATLQVMEFNLEKRIEFIEHYNEVYKFPQLLVRKNLRNYNRWLKAVKQLKEMEDTGL